MGPRGISELITFIQRNTELRCIDLSRNRVCGEWYSQGEIHGDYENTSFIRFLHIVGASTSIEELNISRNVLGEDDDLLSAIVFTLQSPNNLRVCNISGNNFDSVDIAGIVSCLGTSGKAISLCGETFVGSCIDLRRCNLKPVDGSLLFASMKATSPSTITSLRLADNVTFGQGGLVYLEEVLRGIPDAGFRLTSLDVSNTSLSVQDCVTIGRALKHYNCALQSLDISRNCITIGAEGFGAIVRALQANRTLTHMNLTGSVPNNANVPDLAAAIRKNTVRTLVVSEVIGSQLRDSSFLVCGWLCFYACVLIWRPVNVPIDIRLWCVYILDSYLYQENESISNLRIHGLLHCRRYDALFCPKYVRH